MDRDQRDHLIDLLRGLGDADDSVVLDRARAAAALLAGAGLDWTDVVARPAPARRLSEDDFDHDGLDFAADDEAGEPLAVDSADDTQIGEVIQRLLGQDSLGSETVAELQDFAADLAAGQLDSGDRAYIVALAARLGLRSA